MRLLNVHTLGLERFPNPEKQPYAILSHTWGTDEITLQDAAALRRGQGEGFSKVRAACKEARRRGLDYVWVDTCCIDKTSSAELSEAINTMFRWYQNSKICFAYLADVPPSSEHEQRSESMAASRWFTRGWTLQELLAPKEMVFLASDWSVIATRHELACQISQITDIEEEYLVTRDQDHQETRQAFLSRTTVAQRMSWASKRRTTREEDMTYCLLGLFDIALPLLYGEGRERAFLRLQQAIVQDPTVFDATLLAWHISVPKTICTPSQAVIPSYWASVLRAILNVDHPWYHGQTIKDPSHIMGLLASDVVFFSGCQKLTLIEVDVDRSLTERGLSITLPMSDDEHPFLILPCHMRNNPWYLITLPLTRRGPTMHARIVQKTGWVDHTAWSRWMHRRVDLITRVLPEPRESLVADPGRKSKTHIYLDTLTELLVILGVLTSAGWLRSTDGFRITSHLPQWYRQSPECLVAAVLQVPGTETQFTVFLEAIAPHTLLRPFHGSVRVTAYYRPDLSSFEDVEYVFDNERRSLLGASNFISRRGSVFFTTSSSSCVAGQPTVIVGFDALPFRRRVIYVRIIAQGVERAITIYLTLFELFYLWAGILMALLYFYSMAMLHVMRPPISAEIGVGWQNLVNSAFGREGDLFGQLLIFINQNKNQMLHLSTLCLFLYMYIPQLSQPFSAGSNFMKRNRLGLTLLFVFMWLKSLSLAQVLVLFLALAVFRQVFSNFVS